MDADDFATALDEFTPSQSETETLERLRDLLPSAIPHSARVVEALFRLLERFPDAEFGAPGPLVHALEGIKGYEARLAVSLARHPITYTVWMCKRVLNAATDPQEEAKWMAALEAAESHPKGNEETRARARELLAFQRRGDDADAT